MHDHAPVLDGRITRWLDGPHITDASELARFFVGVNGVGTLGRAFLHLYLLRPSAEALPGVAGQRAPGNNLRVVPLGAGLSGGGPLLTIPFALIQGFLFSRTGSLLYVLVVHLLFDAIVFMAIVHAHNPDMFAFFIY